MSYYEDVYLARLNKNGTSRQTRIQGAKEKNFLKFLEKSIYKVDLTYNYTNYIGSLQPASGDEKDVISYLLVPKTVIIETGALLDVITGQNTKQKWLVTFQDKNESLGYNKYKVYLLDRVLTWWDTDKQEHTSYVTVASSQDKSVQDIFKNISGLPTVKEAQNFVNLIMPYDEQLQKDYYCKIDGSTRAFVVTGFDCETVSGVQYTTLDITMIRHEDNPTATPSSFWGG